MSPEELARKWVDTWSEGDFDANKDLVAPDAWLGITAPSAGTSREQGDQDARAWKATFPDGKGRITNMLVSGDNVAMEVEWTGTNTGGMLGMPPNGKSVRAAGAVFLTAKDGKIIHLMHHLDVAGMLMQLGMLPAPGQ
jgi:steroid delta-isomerase-like uncharacterized protein